MKKTCLFACLLLSSVAVLAQTDEADEREKSYIVKTRGVQKAATDTAEAADSIPAEEEEQATDFLGRYFKHKSLCDWTEGMKFMVMPEKYDLVVKTFTDVATGREVGSMSLRHKVMVYQGHTQSPYGKARLNFHCEDNGKDYYYEVPNGSFDDYCFGHLGVPTLAYLGDVDIAREQLRGKTMYTKTKVFRVDTEYEGDGYKEIVRPSLNEEVKVKAIGVGTRSFPVKIIVEDAEGNEFYQVVAMSKTNSGMRDDEFIMDSLKHTFYGAFELQDAIMAVTKDYASYIGKTVHNKFVTPMLTRGDGKDRTVNVPKLTTFTVESIRTLNNTKYVGLLLKEVESRREYYKEVTFVPTDDVTGDIDGKNDDYFGYLFAMGEGIDRETSSAARAAIRQGRVILGMSEDEVILAMGEEPNQKLTGSNGTYDWIYMRSKGKSLIIHFGRNGRVASYKTEAGASK